MKSQPDFHTRAEIDQLIEEIYRTLETTEERLDRRCDDIYFPMDLTMSDVTSHIEANTKGISGDSGIHRPSTRSINIDRHTHQHIDLQSQEDIDRRSYKPRQASTKGDIRQIAEDRKHNYNNEGQMAQRR
ncbi:hypothetical protein DY000_02049244 [Brassica cretica]|uniref:Uncharacterized protein n=1 Tax=Brassica cretica TaxID=69181 RepID=A0ABQ7F3M9_BRACR|nr:hypothetical protein DY000_02049244 [Brassica cretica]